MWCATIQGLAVAVLVATQSIGAQTRLTSPLPRFPAILLSAGFSGSVHAQYVVDTSGRVDMQTLTMESSHPLFSSAVKTALVNARFEPRPQPDRREELFVFSNVAEATPIEIAVRDSTPDGLPRTTVGYPLLDSTAASTYNAWELRAATEHVTSTIIDSIALKIAGKYAPTYCLAGQDSATLLRIRATERHVVPMSECPHTYASMVTTLDSPGRVVDPAPRGWIDPYLITIASIDPWTIGVVRVIVDVEQGTAGTRYLCGIGRNAATVPAKCEIVRWWVS